MGIELPFSSDPVEEIPLAHAPLVKVIAQVRFPIVAAIAQADFIAAFQEMIRQEYPVLRGETSVGLQLSDADGGIRPSSSIAWRFIDRSEQWQVALAPSHVAIDTTSYTSRADFLARFDRVLMALAATIQPATFDRIGMRYIDRIPASTFDDVRPLILPAILGLSSEHLGNSSVHLDHMVSDAQFSLQEGVLRARWGWLPPSGAFDASVEAISQPSWMLDLDAFTQTSGDFAPSLIIGSCEAFAKVIYRFFRWATTDEFIQAFRE